MKLLNLGMAAVLLGGAVFGKEPAAASAKLKEADKQVKTEAVQTKLLPLISMEQAFVRSLQRRNSLAVLVSRQQSELKALKGAELEKAKKNLEQLKRALAQKVAYMDAVYRLDGTRSYEYNPVTSTVYLRVGTVAEAFGRAVQTRDFLAKRALALNTEMEAEKDPGKKAALKKQYDSAASGWALMVNALYDVFQVHPKRQYEYNPSNAVLFLKTSDAEISKLQAELDNARKKASTGKEAGQKGSK